jgi:glycosyltransferase involved in cell wall biosynthesis
VNRPRGGAESQVATLAESMAARGYGVSVILTDYFGEMLRRERTSSLPLINAYDEHAGVPGLRFVPRWRGLVRAMRAADADVYYQMCAGASAGQIALWTHRARRGFIFATASNMDTHPAEVGLGPRDQWLYRYGLRHADIVLTQHDGQRADLRANYGVDSNVVALGVDVPAVVTPPATPPELLWLGSIKAIKRPELLLDLARRMPDVRFVMAGGRVAGEESVYDGAAAAARALPNLTFAGTVPDTAPYVARAYALVSTSVIEGFPTVFLEAWAHGVPTVSYFDPGGLIAREGLSPVVASAGEMEAAIRRLVDDRGERDALGERARAYVRREHDAGLVAARFEDTLYEAAARHGRG